jgi:dTDP-glucose 4,6-dehydratase
VRTALVTGGCGFIGGYFVQHLLEETEWRVVNHDKLTYAANCARLGDISDGDRYRFVRGDIADAALVNDVFRTERPWAVLNFAAESHVDRSIVETAPFVEANVVGTQVLLDAAREHGVERFIQISTDEVYGDCDGMEPRHETNSLSPSNPYAASKAAADLLCMAYRRTHGVSVQIIRSCNNYGPGQYPEKLIPLMVRNALSDRDLPVYGDGLQQRDWVYVEDNVRAIYMALVEGETGEIYNVGAGRPQTNLDVIHAICRILGEEAGMDEQELLARISHVPDRPGHDLIYAMNFSNIAKLGWAPRISFEEGLRRTVRWHLEHPERTNNLSGPGYAEYFQQVHSNGEG